MLLLLLLAASAATAQQIGKLIPEVHPHLPTQLCTAKEGCKTMQTRLVMDVLARPRHAAGQSTAACSSGSATASNCAVEGVADYAAMGVTTKGGSLTLKMFGSGKGSGNGTLPSLHPRVHLLGDDDYNYAQLSLLGQELTFDVDVSRAGCGVNGALYLSEMDPSGGRSAKTNPAGAQYGTGYCDAQCPGGGIGGASWVYDQTSGNNNTGGICCNEMDIWEANRASTVFTPHPCNKAGPFVCRDDVACGRGPGGVCDKDGCSANPYRQGEKKFYGVGGEVDTKRPFTVVTQFLTENGTASKSKSDSKSANLSQIKRLFIQDGHVVSKTNEMPPGTAMDQTFCKNSKADDFVRLGGMETAGGALHRGMVLVFSIWTSTGDFMQWLDSGNNGPCQAKEGDPATIMRNNKDAQVVFSNIRWGELGSTFKAGGSGGK